MDRSDYPLRTREQSEVTCVRTSETFDPLFINPPPRSNASTERQLVIDISFNTVDYRRLFA